MITEPIENHGIIGDLKTVALVGMDATIDFCCWPRFDSPTIFAALLDPERGGRFELKPLLDDARQRQLYLNETNLLLTRTLSKDGVAEVSDFMSIGDRDGEQRLIRRAKAVKSEIRFRMRCLPAFDYGRAGHQIDADGDSYVFSSLGQDGTRLRLRATVPLRVDCDAAYAEFTLPAGQSAEFVLESARADGLAAEKTYVSDAFKATGDYWRAWSSKSTYNGRWREIVNRSALVLKLLTSAQYGSIVAAATFGLPETPGGVRNWDYRYTWMRDSSFTINAFLALGYVDETTAFMRWIQDRAKESAQDGTVRLMYRLDGSIDLKEQELPNLRGYQGASPVRIGNEAFNQLQLDIYGELMASFYLSESVDGRVSWHAWEGITRSMNWVAANWRRPDQGIWEVRGGPQEFLHSRVMCWVALDRALKLARSRSLPAPTELWTTTRDEIYRDVHESFWDPAGETFVQRKGSVDVDASCLLMPIVGFISGTDPRWLSTLKTVGERLADDSLLHRYRVDGETDGLTGDEGSFNMCSFWYVECLARAGQVKKARFLFEKMLGYANHLGLFSEETGPAGEQLGNFPQAFTHMALVSAAHYLNESLEAPGEMNGQARLSRAGHDRS